MFLGGHIRWLCPNGVVRDRSLDPPHAWPAILVHPVAQLVGTFGIVVVAHLVRPSPLDIHCRRQRKSATAGFPRSFESDRVFAIVATFTQIRTQNWIAVLLRLCV